MRSLCGAMILLIFIICLTLWCALSTEHAAKSLTAAAEGDVSVLTEMWEKQRFCLSLTVNRALIAECERALAEMQACGADDPLFETARRNFLTALSVMRDSYGLHFRAVL